MKHLNEDREVCQFRLGFEKQQWCRSEDSKVGTCGSCQSCICVNKLQDTKQWLVQAGGALKLKFLMGILIRCKSVHILESTQRIIQVALGKDFTYARSRKEAKVPDDWTTSYRDKANDRKWFETKVLETWDWFSGSQYGVKANYIVGLLYSCETDRLQSLGNLIRVLIQREKHALQLHDSVLDDLEDDTSSIPDSHYSFRPEDRPELELLLHTRSMSMVLDLPGETRDPDSPEIPLDIPSNTMPSEQQWESLGLSKEACQPRSAVSECPGGITELGKGASGAQMMYPEEPALTVVPGSSTSLSGVSRHRDFIRSLPVHLAKRILGLLNRAALLSCHDVSRHWRVLTEEVNEEIETKRTVENQAMIMQGSSAACVPTAYRKIREVLVPTAEKQEDVVPEVGMDRAFESAYSGYSTKTVEMEERNMFCGAYNILVLSDREDSSRVVHYSGGQLVAVGSKDRLVRLLDVRAMRERRLVMKGHAGSIRAVHLCEDRGLVISTGYDLTIRCWDLRTGACRMLFRGHFGTINCLDLHGNTLVSGAKDCRVKVWNLRTGRCLQRLRFRHDSPVLCVRVERGLVLSSCDRGVLKLWDTDSGGLLKLINSLQGAVKCLHLDQWHMLSGGSDGYVTAWSTSRGHTQSLMTYRHPREVLSLSFLFLRVITGCVDGKIRVFDFLTGNCLRILISNSQQSPALSLHIHDNNIVINTRTSVLIFQFGKEGSELSESVEGEGEDKEVQQDSSKSHPHSWQQAERNSFSHHAHSVSTPRMQREKSTQLRPCRPATGSLLQGRRPSLAHRTLHPGPNAKPPTALCLRTGSRGTRPRPRTIPVRNPVPVKWGWAHSEGTKKQGLCRPPANKQVHREVNVSRQPQRCSRPDCSIHPEVGLPEAPFSGTTNPATPALSSPFYQICPFPASPSVERALTGRGLGSSHTHASMEIGSKQLGGSSGMGLGKTVCKVGVLTTTAERDVDPDQCLLMSAPCGRPRRRVCFNEPFDPAPAPAVTFDPFRWHSPFRLLTTGQQEEKEREAQREYDEARARERRREEKQRRMAWRMMAKGCPSALYRKEDQIHAPELGPGTYI